jgi:putative multiple sugar transport system ATP-binding protein
MPNSRYLLEMKEIIKEFPGVLALNHVNLKVKEGEILALVGENGAGKSTLMNILSGVYPFGSYEGDILFNEEVCHFKDIKDSEKKGIAIIHQELALVPYLSIAENIFLGNEPATKGVIDWNKAYERAKSLLKKVGLSDDPYTLIKNIGVGKQQLVEIAKALSKSASLLILDEPTAALNDEDSAHLLNLLLSLKKEGMTCIIISHKLNEIIKVADAITIIRDGSTIETLTKGKDDISEARIIKGMVGRELVDRYPKRIPKVGNITFEIKDWRVYDPLVPDRMVLKDVNLHVKKGEIVGIAGLMGSGRTELATSVFGKVYGHKISGTLLKDGKQINLSCVSDAIDHKIAYVTEDRKEAGLILINDIKTNISLASLDKLSKRGCIDKNQEIKAATNYKKKLGIKSSSILQKVGNLSGGNQQKVVLSKWMLTQPDLLILDEPTRGIDVGAKYEIYTIINELADSGKSILMISSELPEILGMCDRIYVMNEGKIVGELTQKEASQESIMEFIMRSSQGA